MFRLCSSARGKISSAAARTVGSIFRPCRSTELSRKRFGELWLAIVVRPELACRRKLVCGLLCDWTKTVPRVLTTSGAPQTAYVCVFAVEPRRNGETGQSSCRFLEVRCWMSFWRYTQNGAKPGRLAALPRLCCAYCVLFFVRQESAKCEKNRF